MVIWRIKKMAIEIYGNWKKGVYKENSTDRVIECMVPLDYIGGEDKILNNTINISVAIFIPSFFPVFSI